jgi:hypothetical protein
MTKLYSFLCATQLATLCLFSGFYVQRAFADTNSVQVNTATQLYNTSVDEEIAQSLQFKSLDSDYIYYRNLPLAMRILGMRYNGNNGDKLVSEIDTRLKKYRESTSKPEAINEARAVLEADAKDTDDVVKNRLTLIELVIGSNPSELSANPHGSNKRFMLFQKVD